MTELEVKRHWDYAELLNEELGNATRYVELDEANFATYSLEFTRIILTACSEVEVVCRHLCDLAYPERNNYFTENKVGMKKLAKSILAKYPKIYQAKMSTPRLGEDIFPFAPWKEGCKDVLPWWYAYNRVKHNRGTEYKKATLENAVYSVAGLLVIVSYLYITVTGQATPKMINNGVFDSNYSYCGLKVGPTEMLPDFVKE